MTEVEQIKRLLEIALKESKGAEPSVLGLQESNDGISQHASDEIDRAHHGRDQRAHQARSAAAGESPLQPDVRKDLRDSERAGSESRESTTDGVGALLGWEPPQHKHDFAHYEICRICGKTEAALTSCHHCDDPMSVKNGRCWWCLKERSLLSGEGRPDLSDPCPECRARSQGNDAAELPALPVDLDTTLRWLLERACCQEVQQLAHHARTLIRPGLGGEHRPDLPLPLNQDKTATFDPARASGSHAPSDPEQ